VNTGGLKMADTELKYCPFCDSGKVQICYGIDYTVSGIRCANCGVIVQWPRIKAKRNKTFGEMAKPYIDAWNRRGVDYR
jgi:transcription elongation factor Elf1